MRVYDVPAGLVSCIPCVGTYYATEKVLAVVSGLENQTGDEQLKLN